MGDDMQAHLEIRSQHAKRGKGGWNGPDTYVAVQLVPEGVEPLRYLNRSVAERRGIKIIRCGEGYHRHSGPRSDLGQAIAKAKAIVAEYQSTESALA